MRLKVHPFNAVNGQRGGSGYSAAQPEVCVWRRAFTEAGWTHGQLWSIAAGCIRNMSDIQYVRVIKFRASGFLDYKNKQLSPSFRGFWYRLSHFMKTSVFHAAVHISALLWTPHVALALTRERIGNVFHSLAPPSFLYSPPICRVLDMRCICMASARWPPTAGGIFGICLNVLTPPRSAASPESCSRLAEGTGGQIGLRGVTLRPNPLYAWQRLSINEVVKGGNICCGGEGKVSHS